MKFLSFIFCMFASLTLEAAYFHTSTDVSALESPQDLSAKAYLVESQIEKVNDNNQHQLIASPKFICTAGSESDFTCESENKEDTISFRIFIPENTRQEKIQISFLIKENNTIVFHNEQNFLLNN